MDASKLDKRPFAVHNPWIMNGSNFWDSQGRLAGRGLALSSPIWSPTPSLIVVGSHLAPNKDDAIVSISSRVPDALFPWIRWKMNDASDSSKPLRKETDRIVGDKGAPIPLRIACCLLDAAAYSWIELYDEEFIRTIAAAAASTVVICDVAFSAEPTHHRQALSP